MRRGLLWPSGHGDSFSDLGWASDDAKKVSDTPFRPRRNQVLNSFRSFLR